MLRAFLWSTESPGAAHLRVCPVAYIAAGCPVSGAHRWVPVVSYSLEKQSSPSASWNIYPH